MIMGCIVMAVAWIMLLRTFAKTIVFASEFIKIGALLYLWYSSSSMIFLVIAGGYALYTFCARKQLLFAAKIISHAATGLKENPQMFIALFIVKAFYIVQALLYIKFFEASVTIKTVDISIHTSVDYSAPMVCSVTSYSCEWDETTFTSPCHDAGESCSYPEEGNVGTCELMEPSWVGSGRSFIMLMWLWSVMFFTQFRLAIVANVLGSWHWHPDNKPSPMQALSVTATKSFGTISYSGLICALVEKFYQLAKLKWYHFMPPMLFAVAPLKIVLCIVGWCFKTCIQMLTKFSLILHVFTGDTFFGSAKKCYGIMKRHFVGGFITEASSKQIMTMFSYIMAFAFCFATWAWVDEEFNWKTIPGTSDDAMWVLWALLASFCIYYPLIGLFVLVLIDGLMKSLTQGIVDNEGMAARLCLPSDSPTSTDPDVYDYCCKASDVEGQEQDCMSKDWVSPFCGIFVGCITKLFFDYMGGIILDSIDVMFLCFAIDKDNNVDLSKSEFAAICVDIPGVITTANPLQDSKDPLLVQQPVQPGQFVTGAGAGMPQGQVQPFAAPMVGGGVQMMPQQGVQMMPMAAMGQPVAMGQPMAMPMANMTPEQMQQQQMMMQQQMAMMQQQQQQMQMMSQQPQQATM